MKLEVNFLNTIQIKNSFLIKSSLKLNLIDINSVILRENH